MINVWADVGSSYLHVHIERSGEDTFPDATIHLFAGCQHWCEEGDSSGCSHCIGNESARRWCPLGVIE